MVDFKLSGAETQMKNRFITLICVVLFLGLTTDVSADVERFENRYVEMTLERYDDAVITIGVIENGEASYYVYTEDGAEENGDVYQYEIGSITKTFNGILTARAIEEGKLALDDTLDEILDIEPGDDYPTIEQLLTHTSGYASIYYTDETNDWNNPFADISKPELVRQAEQFVSGRVDYQYSNFGSALLGLVLETVEEESYKTLVEELFETFEMDNSLVYSETEVLEIEENWEWNEDDAYIPVGAIISDVEDMLNYMEINIASDIEAVEQSHTELESLDRTPQRIRDIEIRLDAIGYHWRIDEENEIYYHSGQTSDYGSYFAFNKEEASGVIVMVNTPPSRTPSYPVLIGVDIMHDLLDIDNDYDNDRERRRR